MRNQKKEHIEAAKLRKTLKKGGDNFRWVGVGKVQVKFRGRPTPHQKER